MSQAIDNLLGETVNHTYDYLHRLTGSTATNSSWGEAYSYDGFGNLTGKAPTVGSAPAFLGSVGSNAAGGSMPPNFDVENRLTASTPSNSADHYSYIYDLWGRRVWKQDFNSNSGVTTAEAYFYGATGQKLETYLCNWNSIGQLGGASEGINTYFAGKILSEKGVFIATDRLGSVRADSNGVTMSYYPWGEERGSGTPDNRTKFAGYFRDMPGQDYAMARYYSASSGSFWSPDPGGMKTADSGNPTSWNRYLYGSGDPVNRIDPFGREDCDPEDPCCDPDEGCDEPCVEYLGEGCGEPPSPPGPAPGPPPEPAGPDCNAIVSAVGFAGLTYTNATEIWNDGNLSSYSTDAAAAGIAALAAVTWQGENSFQTASVNHLNPDGSVDIGPFQLNYSTWKGVAPPAAFGTNVLGGQKFNGSVSANIGFAIGYLETLVNKYGDNAAGAYIDGHVPKKGFKGHAKARENTWQQNESKLTTLFENQDCFKHN